MKLISWPENRQCEVRQLNNQADNVKKNIHCHHNPVRLFTVKYIHCHHNPVRLFTVKYFPSDLIDTFQHAWYFRKSDGSFFSPVFLPILGLCSSKGYALFWDVTKGKLVGNYRRFGTSCRSRSQGSAWVPSSRVKLHPWGWNRRFDWRDCRFFFSC